MYPLFHHYRLVQFCSFVCKRRLGGIKRIHGGDFFVGVAVIKKYVPLIVVWDDFVVFDDFLAYEFFGTRDLSSPLYH